MHAILLQLLAIAITILQKQEQNAGCQGGIEPCVKQTVEQLQIMNMHSQLAVSQVMCAAMATHGCTRTLAMAKWKNAKTVSCIKTIQPWNGYNR